MNLYYCCNRCNRLKRDYWPATPEAEQQRFIPNPCDHAMFEHLRYRMGEVSQASNAGQFTIRHLDLNDPDAVSFRGGFISMLARLNREMITTETLLSEAQERLSSAETAAERQEVQEAIDLALELKAEQQLELENTVGPITLAAHA